MAEDINYENAQSLAPDGELTLFELTTRTGATIFFKTGVDLVYLGDTYTGVPCSLTSETRSVESTTESPTLSIGGPEFDLAALKPALFSGHVDGGTLQKHVVELQDALDNVNQKITTTYRIKQVKDYNRFSITLLLARFSPSAQTTIPYRKYLRPAYPYVTL